jgi:two-component system OmpR family response regulator
VRVLLVEDDPRISDFVVKGLEERSFFVTLAKTGTEARSQISSGKWDIILMDVMLPDLDGLQLTRMVRYRNDQTPILIISALAEVDDKVAGLDGGADDYITKPFHFRELLSRIHALTRRAKNQPAEKPHLLNVGPIIINIDEHQAYLNETPLHLSPREFKLLLYFINNKNKVLSRDSILHSVWGIDFDNHTNVVDVYVSYLRNKLSDGDPEKLIHTIKGVGYMLKEP